MHNLWVGLGNSLLEFN